MDTFVKSALIGASYGSFCSFVFGMALPDYVVELDPTRCAQAGAAAGALLGISYEFLSRKVSRVALKSIVGGALGLVGGAPIAAMAPLVSTRCLLNESCSRIVQVSCTLASVVLGACAGYASAKSDERTR